MAEAPTTLELLAKELADLDAMLDDLGDEPVITANQLELVKYTLGQAIKRCIQLGRESGG